MTFKWEKCNKCDRKYLDKEKHDEKYHKDIMIPFEYYPIIRKLLKGSKLQVVKQKPKLMVRVAPFIHHPVEICDDIIMEIGKTYMIQERV